LSLACSAAVLFFCRSLAWAAAGLVAANVIVLAFYDFRSEIFSKRQGAAEEQENRKRSGRSADRIRALLRQGFPLGLAAMLSSATASIPRYFLEHYSGPAMLGIFAALMYVLVGGRTMIAALAQSCVAQLSRLYVSGNKRAFNGLLLRQMAVGLALGLAGIVISLVAGKLLLRIVYRPQYAEYSAILVLVMVAAAINYLAEFANSGLLAVRAIAVQPAILALCAGLVLVLSFLLVPRFGIGGGTWAVLITGAVQFAVTLYCLVRTPFPQPEQGTVYP
jgi:O-antigen/teichoic acid export membrane protein